MLLTGTKPVLDKVTLPPRYATHNRFFLKKFFQLFASQKELWYFDGDGCFGT
jgi:hypothetical protein